MNKKQKRGHNKNIQLIKELDREILILPLSIPHSAKPWNGGFLCKIAVDC